MIGAEAHVMVGAWQAIAGHRQSSESRRSPPTAGASLADHRGVDRIAFAHGAKRDRGAGERVGGGIVVP
jgi:hypothetical protein